MDEELYAAIDSIHAEILHIEESEAHDHRMEMLADARGEGERHTSSGPTS